MASSLLPTSEELDPQQNDDLMPICPREQNVLELLEGNSSSVVGSRPLLPLRSLGMAGQVP